MCIISTLIIYTSELILCSTICVHSSLVEYCLHFISVRADPLILNAMKKLYTLNHKLYEQYYVDQAIQKGGNLSAFHGS